MKVGITHISTACILIEINGFKILTDPALDAAGKYYHHGFGAISKKLVDPTFDIEDLLDIDLILLSHHHHKDNLDHKGREILGAAKMIISTKSAAKAIKGIEGLGDWESIPVQTAKISNLRITAVPAQHRPWWLPGFFEGEVTGFVISYEEQDRGVIYISGDTVLFDGLQEITERFDVDIAIFHLGKVQFRYLTFLGKYTMDASDLIKAVQFFRPNTVIPIHYQEWSHFKERDHQVRQIISSHPDVEKKTVYLQSGVRIDI